MVYKLYTLHIVYVHLMIYSGQECCERRHKQDVFISLDLKWEYKKVFILKGNCKSLLIFILIIIN